MPGNKYGRVNIFVCAGIAVISLFLITLPVIASTPGDEFQITFATHTPTLTPFLSKVYGEATIDPNGFSTVFSTRLSASTDQISRTIVLTETLTPSPTFTSTPTFTPTFTPTETPTPRSTSFAWLPILSNDHFIPTNTPTPTPPPPEKVLFCDDLGQPIYIPDDNANGVSDDISVSDGRKLVNLGLYMDITHSWVGDLVVTLRNQRTGEKIALIDRPGIPASQYGCSTDNIITILDDAAAQSVENKCASSPAISGIFLPQESLTSFAGSPASGNWTINVSDHSPNDSGRLNHWCLVTYLSETMPLPSPTPTPAYLPSSAYVSGMSGQDQQLNLDCESRSAVDWARHFGFTIGEMDFLNHLPTSDDPEVGFVGYPNGQWGNIPPDDYGVHAAPVASLLQDYGATAHSYHFLQWDDIRAEIASGNPAIVWIIGGSSYSLVNGIPHLYTAASTKDTTVVAPWEHTVIVVGYTPSNVTILNGSRFVDVPLNQFLDSWSVLQFMAVLGRP